MTFGFHPYSKTDQLKIKDKPAPKKKRYPERKKKRPSHKPEVYKGRVIPRRSTRGRITAKEYNEALRQHGDYCYVCGIKEGLEAHHIKFRSAGGRGRWRNLRFLCSEHHRGDYSPHKDARLRKELEDLHEAMYGEHYASDKYDLFIAGLIPNTTDTAFEDFMKTEAERREKI